MNSVVGPNAYPTVELANRTWLTQPFTSMQSAETLAGGTGTGCQCSPSVVRAMAGHRPGPRRQSAIPNAHASSAPMKVRSRIRNPVSTSRCDDGGVVVAGWVVGG